MRKAIEYILHMRPLAQLVTMIPFALGYLLSGARNIGEFVFGAFVWLVLLNAGTVAFNSYYDKDDGPINFLSRPPKATKGLLLFSWALKLCGLLLAAFINHDFLLLYALSVILSVLYSHSFFRLKTKYGMDLLINMVGYGLMTPLAGWFLSGNHLNIKFVFAGLIGVFFMGAVVPLTQIFQYEREKRSGETGFTVLVGVPIALFTSIVLFSAGNFVAMFFILAYDLPFLLFLAYCAIALVMYCHLHHWFRHFRVLNAIKELYKTYGYAAAGGIIFALSLIFL